MQNLDEISEEIPEIPEEIPEDDQPKVGRGRPKKTDAPPTTPTSRTKSTPRKSVDDTLREEILMMYQFFGSILSMKDPYCGSAIMAQAEVCADAWMVLAKQNPKLKKVLKSAAAPSGYIGIALVHAPILISVYSHHLTRPQNSPAVDNPSPVE